MPTKKKKTSKKKTSKKKTSKKKTSVALTAGAVRRLALKMPGARESSHFGGVPDFRFGKKIFATLEKHGQSGGLYNLSDERKAELVAKGPLVFYIRGAALYFKLANTTARRFAPVLREAFEATRSRLAAEEASL